MALNSTITIHMRLTKKKQISNKHLSPYLPTECV